MNKKRKKMETVETEEWEPFSGSNDDEYVQENTLDNMDDEWPDEVPQDRSNDFDMDDETDVVVAPNTWNDEKKYQGAEYKIILSSKTNFKPQVMKKLSGYNMSWSDITNSAIIDNTEHNQDKGLYIYFDRKEGIELPSYLDKDYQLYMYCNKNNCKNKIKGFKKFSEHMKKVEKRISYNWYKKNINSRENLLFINNHNIKLEGNFYYPDRFENLCMGKNEMECKREKTCEYKNDACVPRKQIEKKNITYSTDSCLQRKRNRE